jgi:hypothetical protein
MLLILRTTNSIWNKLRGLPDEALA